MRTSPEASAPATAPTPIMSSELIGLTFCGIVDEAPRWLVKGSKTSPISVRDRSTMLRPSFAQVPAIVAQIQPYSDRTSRSTCQGTGTSARPSSAASRDRIPTERGPSAAFVPPAPKSDTTAIRSWACCRRVRWRRTWSSRVASVAPKVVGTACWACVRPGITVPACSVARSARASPRRWSRSSRASRERDIWSASAVSMMSWVVAP